MSRFWWPQGLVDELVRRGFHVAASDQRDSGQSTHFPDTGVASPIAAVLRRRFPAYTAEDMTDDAGALAHGGCRRRPVAEVERRGSGRFCEHS